MGAESKKISDTRSETALYAILWPHKEAMLERWIGIVHGTYPFDTVGFLRTQKDQFANPVGYRTDKAANALLDLLFTEKPDESSLRAAVEDIVKVRAIQDFPPETAVGVFFALKDVARDVVLKSGQEAACLLALLALESRVDAVVLMAFGAYARNRETLHTLRVEEFKRSHSQVLRLAMRKAGMESEDGGTPNP